MLKGAHLSERKSREILSLFCDDLTATQIAEITGVSRVTINAYMKMIRTRLAEFCNRSFPFQEILDSNPQPAIQFADHTASMYYGFTRWNGLVFSSSLPDANKETILQWQHPTLSLQENHPMKHIHAVADFSNWRLYRKDAGNGHNTRMNSDEISGFWGLTRNRLLKFRGLNRSTLYLHIKECEFRYNNRNSDLQMTLLQMINKQPLQTLQMQD